MVLELVRPWRFPIRELPFEQKEHQEQEQQQQQGGKAAKKNHPFLWVSEVTLGSFLARFWNLFVLQRHGVSPPAGDFFEAVLLQQPQATEAVEKGCFSRISEETLGSFLAWFWNLFVHGAFQSGSCLLNRRSIKSRSSSSS